jgi:hypothetical protein
MLTGTHDAVKPLATASAYDDMEGTKQRGDTRGIELQGGRTRTKITERQEEFLP